MHHIWAEYDKLIMMNHFCVTNDSATIIQFVHAYHTRLKGDKFIVFSLFLFQLYVRVVHLFCSVFTSTFNDAKTKLAPF